MALIVRDEDPPTVAAAITAYATEEGLEVVDLEALAQDPMSLIGILAGPRVMVSMSHDQVVVVGLESLDIAEAEEWGTTLSTACETEVIAAEVFEDGIRIYVFDGGERDSEIEVPLDRSGRTPAPQLAELAETDEGKRQLEAGVVGSTAGDLLQGVLECLGATSPDTASVIMLAFRDPLDDAEEEEEEDEPGDVTS